MDRLTIRWVHDRREASAQRPVTAHLAQYHRRHERRGGGRGGAVALDAIRQTYAVVLQSRPFELHVTASFGVALGRHGERMWPQLVMLADEALYRAKSDGRNRVRYARNVTVTSLGYSVG